MSIAIAYVLIFIGFVYELVGANGILWTSQRAIAPTYLSKFHI
jgi:hypothetical protein